MTKSIKFIRLTNNLSLQSSDSEIPTKFFYRFFAKKSKKGMFKPKF